MIARIAKGSPLDCLKNPSTMHQLRNDRTRSDILEVSKPCSFTIVTLRIPTLIFLNRKTCPSEPHETPLIT